jgi:hypothetical protein
MPYKSFLFILFPVVFSFLFLNRNYTTGKMPVTGVQQSDTNWSVQLNEMNYLVLRASSINMIYGMHFSREQAEKLKALAEKLAKILPVAPDTHNKVYGGWQEVPGVYKNLVELLQRGDSIPQELKQHVLNVRELEANIIKHSLLGAQKADYTGEGCLKCHAAPEQFPYGDISKMETKTITAGMRREIDQAHVKGLFGEEGMLMLWRVKDTVWDILNNGQRYVIKDFRCCLIPSDLLSDPARIGQAAFTGEWGEYLESVRQLSDENWDIYKPLFLLPLEDIIRATLPGVQQKEVKSRIHKVESVLTATRKLSRLDFAIQKENKVDELRKAISIDALNGEAGRADDDRKFISAMFLLYFGSPQLYDRIISQN